MVATVDYHSSGGGYENLRGANPVGGVESMAMPQRDDTIEAIKRLDALLEYAVMHGDEAEAERLRARGKPLCLAGRSRAGLLLGDEAVELGDGVAEGRGFFASNPIDFCGAI